MPSRNELIGVYQPPVTEKLVRAQAELLYGVAPSPAQLEQLLRQLTSTVLVEVLVSDSDADFDVGDFVQENTNLPHTSWQIAWAEAFLCADGQQLLVERWEPRPSHHTTFRVAFFIQ